MPNPTVSVKSVSHQLKELLPDQIAQWKQECLDAFPVGRKFQCLLVDPPWAYRQSSASSALRGLAPYPTMSLQELIDLPVPRVLADTAVLLLWTTGPQLQDAFKLLDGWGLQYTTLFTVWAKTHAGGQPVLNPGFWTRSSCEFLLMARRGPGLAKLRKRFDLRQLVHAPRLAHSQKPDSFSQLIEDLFDVDSRLELFSRRRRPGWSSWGLEVSAGPDGPHFYHHDCV